MLDRICKEGVKAIVRNYNYTIGLSIITILYLFSVLGFSKSFGEDIGTSIGFIALIIAVYSIQSTTRQLKEIQIDYWNTRGIDLREKKKYHDSLQAYEKAINIDSQSIKCYINKANALFERGEILSKQGNSGARSYLIKALDVIETAVDLGIKYPANWKKGTPEEAKAVQEYANAWMTKGNILLNIAKDLGKDENAHYSTDLFPHAIKAIQTAVELYRKLNYGQNPELIGAWSNKGNVLLSIGEYDEAINASNEAIRLDPSNPRAWANRGIALIGKGDALAANNEHNAASKAYEEATENFNRAIALEPDTAMFWFGKGKAFKALGNVDEAVHAYDKAIEFDPQYSDAWNNKGYALFEQGYYGKAIKSYNKAIDINPYDIIVQKNIVLAIDAINKSIADEVNKGITLSGLCIHGEALHSFDRIIKLNPKHVGAFNNKGIALYNLGNYDDSIRAYDKAIEKSPKHSGAWYNKGKALLKLCRYGDALFAFDMVTNLKPEFADAWHSKGIALEKLGKIDEAILAYDQATKLKPDFTAAWHNKGLNLGNLCRNEEALFAFDIVTNLKPEFADAWYNKGIALEKLGKIDETILAYDQATKLKPDFAEVWHYKAIALKLRGRFQEADAAFAKAKAFGYKANPSSALPRSP